MQGPEEDHRSIEDLERYSLRQIDATRTAGLEEHLLICPLCIQKLTQIEPYNFVHHTRQGPFYSRVTRLRTGAFFARHWGRNLEGGKEFRTLAAAKAYLSRSFSQMFPNHVCTARCGSTNPGPAERSGE
jgi:hypothetical protein